MVPGKRYRPEDLLPILRRRRLAILLPFLVAVLATPTLSRFLTDRYQSSTSILVVPQRIPESYVQSTVTSTMEERLQSISQQILSRTRLERIIQNFDLYAEDRRTGLMEDVVELMRRDIDVSIVPMSSAFRVSYTGEDPRTVMRVTERLASLFIEENLRDREVLVEGTNQFLETQLEDARRRLVEHEKRLEEFRRRYSGELPTQVQTNLQVLQNLQLQVQAVVESVNRDRDRRQLLDRLLTDSRTEGQQAIADAQAAVAARDAAQAAAADTAVPAGGSVGEQLEATRAMLRGLEVRLRPEHPDVVRMRRTVQELERKAQEESLATPLAGGAPVAVAQDPASAARRARQQQLQEEVAALDRQIAGNQAKEKELVQRIALYQRRVEAVPERESELTALTRDYGTLQQIYTNLLEKNENAKVAANLERRQIGEQFKILDPARLPERPISPNRMQLNVFGTLLGLVFGVALAGLLEYRDTALRTDDEAIVSLQLPVVAMIPLIRTHSETRRLRRRRLALAATVCITAVGWAAALVWTVM
jgi:polysaccharide chain length determinant protein (PEP-CTERM system associated)